ncbi:MAG: UvrD-helicase domain-containing protein [Treponema sp.]|jgi:ATP-dependent helicase/nuclease subunit A|nr:UvrD-helicase domain-containing protein [Treponema sp.]
MDSKRNHPQLNEEQRTAAFYNGNAVVAAGAGSGKTMVLAARFAWLLTEKGYRVDEILTLTFTTKAAAQMYRRIHSLLSEIAEKETGIGADRARQALDNFIHARIQTLDSYSTALVRQCAPRYGISPEFKIDQARCYEIALEESLPFLIANRRHPAIERLYSDNKPKDIARNIFADTLFSYCHIDRERDFLADMKMQFDIVLREWKEQCGQLTAVLTETENLIFDTPDLLPELGSLMETCRNKKIVIPEFSEIRSFFEFLLNVPPESCIEKAESHPLQDALTTPLYFLAKICRLDLKKGKRFENPVKEKVREIRGIFGKFSSLTVFCMQAGFIFSVMSLLAKLQQRYLARKRSEGVLTFRDVANLSRTILIEQEDIRQSEKESFRAIMIDEFQDNNELQKDLLFLLAEKHEISGKGVTSAEDICPDKLFFVGDEKQSIYLFRGADVSVFRRLKDEIKSADIPLKINYRSAPQLIGAFNAIFGGSDFDPFGKAPLSAMPSVFAPSSASLPFYEAAYTPLEAGKEGNGKLSLCILDKNDNAPPSNEADERLPADENEARFVAGRIKDLLDEKTETGGQKYQPGDIAILFRARSPQRLFEKHLRLFDIPYVSEDTNDFFYGGPVNDIISVLRLAAHPLDSAAYAEMLRSPFAGLSLPGLAVCLSIFMKTENPEPFNDDPLSHLNPEDQDKYRCGQKIYSSICGKIAGESISSLVSELWYNEGYRYETEWNPQISVYREIYDYLFHLAVRADAANQGLAAFTDSMCALRDSGGRLTDIEIPLEHTSGVNLSTIHKSKGLEFPIVFLCCCGKHSQTDTAGEVFFSNEAGIVFSPPMPPACYAIPGIRNNFFWEQSIAEAKRKRTAELRRLLYVGMTRAEKELYLTGSLDIRDRTEKDNFSLKIKNYIERRCNDSEVPVYGDSILDNDTFFGLFLPSVISHIPPDGLAGNSGFFTLDPIPVYTEDGIREWETGSGDLPNDQNGLNAFFEKIELFYRDAEVMETPVLHDNHVTPVSLRGGYDGEPADEPEDHLASRDFFINRDFSGEKSDDVFGKVNSILERLSENSDNNGERFNSGSFGTIAHICVEALLNGKEPAIPSNISGFLTPAVNNALLEAGKELALRFLNSPLGKFAEKANLCESEFAFRSIIKDRSGKEIFISGTVDLFFEKDDFIHVVDFKTDSRETPKEHIAQMSCYYRAVSTLFAKPAKKGCRVWLYYLRTGHAMEVTENVKQFCIEDRLFL